MNMTESHDNDKPNQNLTNWTWPKMNENKKHYHSQKNMLVMSALDRAPAQARYACTGWDTFPSLAGPVASLLHKKKYIRHGG